MVKKIGIAIAAITAILAFAIPSMANATDATCGTGVFCKEGTVVTGTGKNVALDTQFVGKLICGELNLKGTITKNKENTVTAEGASEEPSQKNCFVNGEAAKPIKVTTVKLTMLTANDTTGPAGTIRKGTVSFIAKVDLPNGALCEFTGTNVPGHFISGQDPTVLTPTDPEKDIPSAGGCGKAQLLGEFTLETISGTTVTPVILD